MSTVLFIILSLLLTASLVFIIYGFSTPLVQAALILLYVLIDGEYVGWMTFFIVLMAGISAEVVEFFAGVKGAKKAKGSKASAWGAIIGGFVGAAVLSPFFPIGPIAGSFIGTFLGALLMEFTAADTPSQAFKVGMGAMIGRVLGFCLKTAVSIGIIFGVAGTGLINMFR